MYQLGCLWFGVTELPHLKQLEQQGLTVSLPEAWKWMVPDLVRYVGVLSEHVGHSLGPNGLLVI